MVGDGCILLDAHHISDRLLKVAVEFLDLLVSGKHELVPGLQFILYLPPRFLRIQFI